MVRLIGGSSIIKDAVGNIFVLDAIVRGFQVIPVFAQDTGLSVLVVHAIRNGSLDAGIVAEVVLLHADNAGGGLGEGVVDLTVLDFLHALEEVLTQHVVDLALRTEVCIEVLRDAVRNHSSNREHPQLAHVLLEIIIGRTLDALGDILSVVLDAVVHLLHIDALVVFQVVPLLALNTDQKRSIDGAVLDLLLGKGLALFLAIQVKVAHALLALGEGLIDAAILDGNFLADVVGLQFLDAELVVPENLEYFDVVRVEGDVVEHFIDVIVGIQNVPVHALVALDLGAVLAIEQLLIDEDALVCLGVENVAFFAGTALIGQSIIIAVRNHVFNQHAFPVGQIVASLAALAVLGRIIKNAVVD